MRRARARRARGATTLLAGLLLGGLAAAQQGAAPQDAGKILAETDREEIHPGDAFALVGREQSDNSFRERTPALLRTDRQLALVSAEAARERKLALYEGSVFSGALPAVGSVDASTSILPAADAARRARPPAGAVAIAPQEGSRWLLASCFLAIAGILWLARRLRLRQAKA